MAGGSSGGGGGGKRWLAVIRGADGRVRELGRFSEQGEAGRAYDRAATALHGLKAKLNFAAVAATEPLAGGAAGKTKRQACPGEPCRGGQPGSKRRAKSSQYHGVTWHENPFGINEDSYWIVGDKNGLFEPFTYKNDHFTETGSGLTSGKALTKEMLRFLTERDG